MSTADPQQRIEALEDALYRIGFDLCIMGLNNDDVAAAIGKDRMQIVEARWNAGLKWEAPRVEE
jgi:hypothetical protein